MTTIYDEFLKKLINLKNYTIISENTSNLIVLTKIKLPVKFKFTKNVFCPSQEVREVRVHFLFIIDMTSTKIFYDVLSKEIQDANLPILQIDKKDLEISESDLEKKLQDFIINTLIEANMEFKSDLKYEDLVFKSRP